MPKKKELTKNQVLSIATKKLGMSRFEIESMTRGFLKIGGELTAADIKQAVSEKFSVNFDNLKYNSKNYINSQLKRLNYEKFKTNKDFYNYINNHNTTAKEMAKEFEQMAVSHDKLKFYEKKLIHLQERYNKLGGNISEKQLKEIWVKANEYNLNIDIYAKQFAKQQILTNSEITQKISVNYKIAKSLKPNAENLESIFENNANKTVEDLVNRKTIKGYNNVVPNIATNNYTTKFMKQLLSQLVTVNFKDGTQGIGVLRNFIKPGVTEKYLFDIIKTIRVQYGFTDNNYSNGSDPVMNAFYRIMLNGDIANSFDRSIFFDNIKSIII